MSSPAALAPIVYLYIYIFIYYSQCAKARLHRELKKTSGGPAVAKHTCRQIKMHNARNAVRADDVIDVKGRKRPKITGTGRSKRWLPSACLRCRRKNSQQNS